MAERRLNRGEIWMADLDPIRGHEQGGRRPVLVVSTNRFNHGRAGLVVGLPLTTKSPGLLYHVPLSPPEGGATRPCHIKCEDVRSISIDRLSELLGKVDERTMAQVEDRLRIVLQL